MIFFGDEVVGNGETSSRDFADKVGVNGRHLRHEIDRLTQGSVKNKPPLPKWQGSVSSFHLFVIVYIPAIAKLLLLLRPPMNLTP